MAPRYNAFISYRHAPLDSKVASEIQKKLERARIPRAIQKKTGKKKIERIFRDKEELPITNDINDDIRQTARSTAEMAIAEPMTIRRTFSPPCTSTVWRRTERSAGNFPPATEQLPRMAARSWRDSPQRPRCTSGIRWMSWHRKPGPL